MWVISTMELVMHPHTPPLHINNSAVPVVKFTGSTITSDLKWGNHSSEIIKWAHHRMFFLRLLHEMNISPRVRTQFSRATIKSILTSSVTLWLPTSSAHTERIVSQSPQRPGTAACACSARGQIQAEGEKDHRAPSHLAHFLSTPLPSGTRRFRSIRTTASRHSNSFSHKALSHLNQPSRIQNPHHSQITSPFTPSLCPAVYIAFFLGLYVLFFTFFLPKSTSL